MNSLTSIVYTVHDLPAARVVHSALLGVEPHTDTPYYIGFNVDGVEVALTPVAPNGAPSGPIAYIAVADIESAIADVVRAGAALADPPKEVGGGTTIATVTDPGGNVLGLIHHAT